MAADLYFGNRSTADFDDRIVLVKLAAGEFVRLHDGDDFFDAVERGQVVLIDQPVFADGADDGAELALAEMRLASHPLDFGDDAVDGRLRRVLVHYDDQGGISSKKPGFFALPERKRGILLGMEGGDNSGVGIGPIVVLARLYI